MLNSDCMLVSSGGLATACTVSQCFYALILLHRHLSRSYCQFSMTQSCGLCQLLDIIAVGIPQSSCALNTVACNNQPSACLNGWPHTLEATQHRENFQEQCVIQCVHEILLISSTLRSYCHTKHTSPLGRQRCVHALRPFGFEVRGRTAQRHCPFKATVLISELIKLDPSCFDCFHFKNLPIVCAVNQSQYF